MDNNQIYLECGVSRVRDYVVGDRRTSLKLSTVMRMTANDAPVRPKFELDGLQILKTGNAKIGMGVRTLEPIKKGRIVATYLGEICFVQPFTTSFDFPGKFA